MPLQWDVLQEPEVIKREPGVTAEWGDRVPVDAPGLPWTKSLSPSLIKKEKNKTKKQPRSATLCFIYANRIERRSKHGAIISQTSQWILTALLEGNRLV